MFTIGYRSGPEFFASLSLRTLAQVALALVLGLTGLILVLIFAFTLGLDPGTADRLISSATRVEGEAVDLYHFTSVIMRSVNEEGRLRIIEMMWELVYADGQVSEFEDNVVWRAADLLGISSRDRIDLKHKVAEQRSAPSAGAPKAEDAAM